MSKKPQTEWEKIREQIQPYHLEYLLKRHADLIWDECFHINKALHSGKEEDVRVALYQLGRKLTWLGNWSKKNEEESKKRDEEESRKRKEERRARKEGEANG
jgi:hypothetical protein